LESAAEDKEVLVVRHLVTNACYHICHKFKPCRKIFMARSCSESIGIPQGRSKKQNSERDGAGGIEGLLISYFGSYGESSILEIPKVRGA